MKIMLIENTFGLNNGEELNVFYFFNILRKNGHEVTVFATDKKPYAEPDYPYQNYFPRYVTYYRFNVFKKVTQFLKRIYNFEAKHRLKKYLKVVQPDLVSMHTVVRYLTPSVIAACKELKIPVVMTVHDGHWVCPAGTLMRAEKDYCHEMLCITDSPLNCVKYKCMDGSRKKGIFNVLEFVIRDWMGLYKQAASYTAPSHAVKKLMVATGLEANRVHVIPNYSRDIYYAAQPDYTHRGYFLFAGRLIRHKGVQYLLEAMRDLPDITLHIAGEGQDEDALKAKAGTLGLKNVIFTGFLTGEALHEEFKHCIATIHPCNWFEAFGLSVAESLMNGKPVIGSDLGGVSEIIDHGVNGLLVEPANVGMLRDAIQQLADNPDLVQKMGKAGRQKAEKQYRGQQYYEDHIKLFEAVLRNQVPLALDN